MNISTEAVHVGQVLWHVEGDRVEKWTVISGGGNYFEAHSEDTRRIFEYAKVPEGYFCEQPISAEEYERQVAKKEIRFKLVKAIVTPELTIRKGTVGYFKRTVIDKRNVILFVYGLKQFRLSDSYIISGDWFSFFEVPVREVKTVNDFLYADFKKS